MVIFLNVVGKVTKKKIQITQDWYYLILILNIVVIVKYWWYYIIMVVAWLVC